MFSSLYSPRLYFLPVLLALFCSGNLLFAQSIRVADSAGNALPFAHVFIQPTDKTPSIYLITNDSGECSLPEKLLYKEIIIRVSFLGYNDYSDTLTLHEPLLVLLQDGAGKLDEIVVTAQYTPGNADKSVHKINVIDSKKIKEMAAVQLKDVLAYELNIRLSQDNILGTGMTMQGISGENVKIMIDGVPVIGRQNGNIDLSQINLLDIERIEIVEGPLSVSYGTNALAGTINLITRKENKKHFNAEIDSYNENNGTYNLQALAAYTFGKNRISISGGRNIFDGWSLQDSPWPELGKSPADSSRFKTWKPRTQYFSRLQYNSSIKKHTIGYKGEFFKEKITNRGLPRAPYAESAFDDYYFTTRIDNALYGNGNVGKKYYLQWVGAYNYYQRIKNAYYTDLTNLENQLTSTPGDQDTSVFHQWMFRGSISSGKEGDRFRFEAGTDIQAEKAIGVRIDGLSKTLADIALFSTATITPIKNLQIKPGLRVAYNTAFKAPPVPSLHLKYDFKNADIRASYAYGFRAPAIKELYFIFVDINHNIVGNPDLRAEYGHHYTLDIQFKKWKKHTLFKSNINLFFNDIHNLITLGLQNDGQYRYVNAGRYKTLGISLQQNIRWKWLQAQAGLTYTGRYNDLDALSGWDAFTFSPEVNARFSAQWDKAGLNLAIYYKYQGQLPSISVDNNGQLLRTFTEGWHMADITLTKSFWKERIRIAAGCKNLAGVTTVTSAISGGAHSSGGQTSVGMGRIGFIKLTFSWN